jgi:hypothetical protein
MARSAWQTRAGLGLAALTFVGAQGGCATHSGGAASEPAAQQPAAQQPAAKQTAKPAEPPRGVPPPASSKLSKVQLGWNDEQVRAAIGAPDNVEGYITGKSFIPFYYGTDTSRSDGEYLGEGRVVFSRNAYSGTLKVIRIDYDPNELAN